MSAELNRGGCVYATVDVAGWVRGYIITPPGSAARHVRNGLEFDGSGRRMAQPTDYEHVAEVLNAADILRAGAPSEHGNATVVALKRIAGETFHAVFDVLVGKRNRALALRSPVIKA